MEGKSMSCNIITDMNKPPKWFAEFVEKQFKPLVQKVSKIEEFNEKLDSKVSNIESRLDNLVKKNNLKE
jgi:predicted nuclease with TOPRIM domain